MKHSEREKSAVRCVNTTIQLNVYRKVLRLSCRFFLPRSIIIFKSPSVEPLHRALTTTLAALLLAITRSMLEYISLHRFPISQLYVPEIFLHLLFAYGDLSWICLHTHHTAATMSLNSSHAIFRSHHDDYCVWANFVAKTISSHVDFLFWHYVKARNNIVSGAVSSQFTDYSTLFQRH